VQILSKLMLTAATVLAMAGSAAAQSCATFVAVPENASLVVRGLKQYASGAPGTFCSLRPGEKYRLTVAAPGYQTRNLKFRIEDDGRVSTGGVWAAPTGRSILLPGWGQVSMGNTARGTWAFALGAGTGGYLWGSYYLWQETKDEYDEIQRLAQSATTETELRRLESEAVSKAQKANVNKQRFEEVLILTGYVHATNIVETFLLSRPPRAAVEGSTVNLRISQLSSAGATTRSVLFPGLGQKYMGSHFKGWFMQSLFIGGAIGCIEWRADYATAENEYNNVLAQIDNATTIDEINAARAQAPRAWDDLQYRKRWRNFFYVATGTVWAWSVLDAAFITKPDTTGGKIGFETSLRGSSIETGLSLRF
jgi:hypothetical protein